MFSLWVKRLTAFGWLLACAYGAGYFLGRIAPSNNLPEYVLLYTLLFIGICFAALPLALTWLPQHFSFSPLHSVSRAKAKVKTSHHQVPCSITWEKFLEDYEDDLEELAALPRVIERLYTS